MDEPATGYPDPALDEARAEARSDDGQVTAVVDGIGLLVELTLEPTIMRKSSEDVATLVRTTVRAAQDDAREQARQLLTDAAPAMPAAAELTSTLQDLQATATSRLAEMSATLQHLIERSEGGNR